MKPVTQGDDDASLSAGIHEDEGCRRLMPGVGKAEWWGSPHHRDGKRSKGKGPVRGAPAASAPRPLPGGRRQGITAPWDSCPCRRIRLGPLRPVCGSEWWTPHALRRRGRCPPPCSRSNGRHILPFGSSPSACCAVSSRAGASWLVGATANASPRRQNKEGQSLRLIPPFIARKPSSSFHNPPKGAIRRGRPCGCRGWPGGWRWCLRGPRGRSPGRSPGRPSGAPGWRSAPRGAR